MEKLFTWCNGFPCALTNVYLKRPNNIETLILFKSLHLFYINDLARLVIVKKSLLLYLINKFLRNLSCLFRPKSKHKDIYYTLLFLFTLEMWSHIISFMDKLKNWLVLIDFCNLANTFFTMLIWKLISTDISHSNDW